MPESLLGILGVVLGLVVGVGVGILVGRALSNAPRVAAETRLEEASRQLADQAQRREDLAAQLSAAQQDLARLEEANRSLAEQRKLLEDARTQLSDAFKALSSEALDKSNQQFLALAKQTLGGIVAETKGDIGKRQEAIDGLIRPLQESLRRYEEQVAALEQKRVGAYEGLGEQLRQLSEAQRGLQSAATRLEGALRSPVIRGSWGEVQLRRVVELAGMQEHVDFDEQAKAQEGRPDMIVRLPNDSVLPVDAKAPMAAYWDAVNTGDVEARKAKLGDHARAVRERVKELSAREYWQQFPRSPEFVVLFAPNDASLTAAFEADPTLLEFAFGRRVLVTTPVTLLALLKTVAYGWQQHQIVENAQAIAEASKEFYGRVATFARHLGGIEAGLAKAVDAHDAAVRSWNRNVEPSGRRVARLGGADRAKEMPELKPLEEPTCELPTLEPGPLDEDEGIGFDDATDPTEASP